MISSQFSHIRSINGPILITGHTGFKGTWMTLLLEHLGLEVVGLSLGYVGNWMPTDVSNTVTEMERLANGNWLVTATITVDSILESDFLIPVGSRGYDLIDQPTSITTRILLNSGKSQILAQAVLVADTKKGGM